MAVGLRPAEVAVRRWDGVVHWVLEPDASSAGFRQAQLWLHAILASREASADRIGDVELIAEELLTNVVRAAGSRREGVRLSLECALTTSDIMLTFRDDGPQFDPTAVESPDLNADITDREVGGLGILLVRKLADDCRYSRLDGWNVVEIRFGRTPLK
jgi:sigma-B regulation protein RsbU (phosphoserine phosphatase)